MIVKWFRRLLGTSLSTSRLHAPVDADTANEHTTEISDPEEEAGFVRGERYIPSVNRVRSLQSRISGVLAIALVSVVALGFLVWYYSQALTRSERAQRAAERATMQRAQVETEVPPLGPIEPPRVAPVDAAPSAESLIARRILGAPPPPPELSRSSTSSRAAYPTDRRQSRDTLAASAQKRRLAGPVLVDIAERGQRGRTGQADAREAPGDGLPIARDSASSDSGSSDLGRLLTPTAVHATQARLLPELDLLLQKSTLIDCTLETAIDTSLQGFVT